jgi:hypothetical protein
LFHNYEDYLPTLERFSATPVFQYKYKKLFKFIKKIFTYKMYIII